MFGGRGASLEAQWFRLRSQCRGHGAHPWLGSQVPPAEHHSQEKVWSLPRARQCSRREACRVDRTCLLGGETIHR